MARFFGNVGYGESVESKPGVWTEEPIEQAYYGDVVRKARNLEGGEGLNDDISVSHSISIMADEYAIKNFSKIKYVRWEGAVWTVTDVEVRRPRLILSLGGVYNGPTVSPAESP